MRLARVRMGRLLTWKGALSANPPQVTILIPAKDEGASIHQCVESALAQDYPDFNVIVINDRSTDDTGKILDELAKDHGRMKIIHIPPATLPVGWLGKCHALQVGTHSLLVGDSTWFFFVDSDVTLAPEALSRAVSIAIERKYDAVSILTKLECHHFIEELMLPALAGAWTIMHTVSLTNEDTRKTIAYANGQFFLIRREAYEAVGGHQAVKNQITEDVELMRLLKSSDFTVRLFMGADLATTRMHSNLKQMFHGWGRIYSGTARRRPWRILGAIVFIMCCTLMAYPALAWGISRMVLLNDWRWFTAAVIHFVLMSLFIALIYHWSGNRARHALLLPLSAPLMLAIFIFSLRKCQTGKISWRGTEYSAT